MVSRACTGAVFGPGFRGMVGIVAKVSIRAMSTPKSVLNQYKFDLRIVCIDCIV
jgi:hypothetical protein